MSDKNLANLQHKYWTVSRGSAYIQVNMVLHQCLTWWAEVRTQFRANLADSFITSPRWPVNTSSPSPSILFASTSSNSPPTVVQAKPTATPGCPSRDQSSLLKYTAGYRQIEQHTLQGTNICYGRTVSSWQILSGIWLPFLHLEGVFQSSTKQ